MLEEFLERLLRIEKNKRNLTPLFIALSIAIGIVLAGVVAIVITQYLFPAAVATLAALLGLSGLGAVIIPLLLVGVIGALFGAELFAFLEMMSSKNNKGYHSFLRNLIIVTALLGGAALGPFLVMSTPFIASSLTFGFMQPLGLGIGAPILIAGLATLILSGAVALLVYRLAKLHITTQALDLEVEEVEENEIQQQKQAPKASDSNSVKSPSGQQPAPAPTSEEEKKKKSPEEAKWVLEVQSMMEAEQGKVLSYENFLNKLKEGVEKAYAKETLIQCLEAMIVIDSAKLDKIEKSLSAKTLPSNVESLKAARVSCKMRMKLCESIKSKIQTEQAKADILEEIGRLETIKPTQPTPSRAKTVSQASMGRGSPLNAGAQGVGSRVPGTVPRASSSPQRPLGVIGGHRFPHS